MLVARPHPGVLCRASDTAVPVVRSGSPDWTKSCSLSAQREPSKAALTHNSQRSHERRELLVTLKQIRLARGSHIQAPAGTAQNDPGRRRSICTVSRRLAALDDGGA